ncbi:MAG: hypothetical protein V3V13_12045 [Paracoccaceae bacterium]
MAGIVQNLIYRVSISAIIGAIVAGGVIYLNTERVNKGLRADMVSYNKYRLEMAGNITKEHGSLIEMLAIVQAENAKNVAELRAEIAYLRASLTDKPAPSVPVAPVVPDIKTENETGAASENELGDIIKIIPAPATEAEQ